MRRSGLLVFLALSALMLAPSAQGADSEYPVAVRWWGQAMVSIETWWGDTIVIDPYATEIGYPDPGVEADTVLMTHEHRDHNNPGLVKGNHADYHGLRDGAFQPVSISNMNTARAASGQMLRIRTIDSFHDDVQGDERGSNAMILVETDGVRILHCGDLGQQELTQSQLAEVSPVDVLCIPVGGVYTIDGPQAVTIIEQIHPRIVVPIHYKTEALKIGLDPIDPFLEALPGWYEVVRPVGNTLAVSSAGGPTRDKPQVVVLGYTPWAMPAELEQLFDAKEAASKESQATFRMLSVKQLNHKPSNGTHTPRWNAEHMGSAELFFYSSVYGAVDPSIAPIRLFPQQMPPDYVAAHPGWNGADEANQMQRIQDFSRRFAYLLDGMPLDELPEGAPGFAGDLRGLFQRMIDHYGEHTAHVHEKFELEDWPE